MRHSGDWMALVDDRVLEYLSEHESGSPAEMKREGPINYSRQYIDKRCKRLTEEGLTKHFGNGIYVITDDGEAYLDGRLDTQEWRYIDHDADEVTASGSEEVPGESNGGTT
ncbi:phage PhiH1 repressor protein [Halorubrum coriense DSM 10284]|uniref:Phage PhiH1 repressor protein n=1 Tax=Halorubrum coriense DSM 10284 TaxID=1227466 RepID=M0EAC9_9EURY|nr:hypothetical protein [Halorubrum coriense]ELZ43369.1 phage PhiH1 repressor protein [Halorubrum coriense DSM 10284]